MSESPAPESPRAVFRRTLVRVLVVQVIALALLGQLGIAYSCGRTMHPGYLAIVRVYLLWVVIDGIRKSKGTDTISGYFIADKSLAWWVVGLSVMATQLSAVTMIGTTGQGATDGLRFVQLYFGLPLAMVILGVTLVPMLHGSGVYTAYEYLERRFDAKTRSLTAFLFLLSRGMSCGTIIAAPGVVLSAIFGIPLAWSVALIGIPTVLYTMIGGVQAVAWADVKQMVLIVVALLSIVVVLVLQMPVSPNEALEIAGATGRLQTFDFSFNLDDPYTFCSMLFVVKFFADSSLATPWGVVTDIGGRATATVFASRRWCSSSVSASSSTTNSSAPPSSTIPLRNRWSSPRRGPRTTTSRSGTPRHSPYARRPRWTSPRRRPSRQRKPRCRPSSPGKPTSRPCGERPPPAPSTSPASRRGT